MDALRRWGLLVLLQMKLLLRDRLALIGSFGLAVISMLLFGSILGGGNSTLKLALAAEEQSPATEQITAAFTRANGVQVQRYQQQAAALASLQRGDVAAVLVLPAGFGQALAARQAQVQVYYDGSNPQRGGQAQAVITGVLGGVNQAISGTPAPIQIAVQGVDRRVIRQIDWLTPGLAGMMIMWANMAVGATLISWRERGILKRLAVTPLRPSILLLTQIVARLAFSILQVVLLLVLARVVFKVEVVGNYWELGLVIVLSTLAILAFGFVIGALVPKSESAQAVSTLIAFPMMFLGGSYFDTAQAPQYLQPLVQALPLTHINDALRQVMIFGGGWSTVQQSLLVLLGWLVLSFALAVRTFRWQAR